MDAKKLIAFIDLTRLESNDSVNQIELLCQKAITPFGNVAAICIYPAFIKRAKLILANSAVRVATVANFPQGEDSIAETLHCIDNAMQSGADEIDVVLPYRRLLAGDKDGVMNFLTQCRLLCNDKLLKVILETGELKTPALITQAAQIAIAAQCDFLKTSTGKVKVGATAAAVAVLLDVISKNTSRNIGIKISGGVREIAQAQAYFQQVTHQMGADWVCPRTFRLGVSRLLDEIVVR